MRIVVFVNLPRLNVLDFGRIPAVKCFDERVSVNVPLAEQLLRSHPCAVGIRQDDESPPRTRFERGANAGKIAR